jgi:hypothetical protein
VAIVGSNLTSGSAALTQGAPGSQNISVTVAQGAAVLVSVHSFNGGAPTLSGLGVVWRVIDDVVGSGGVRLTLFCGEVQAAINGVLTIAWGAQPSTAEWSVDQFLGASGGFSQNQTIAASAVASASIPLGDAAGGDAFFGVFATSGATVLAAGSGYTQLANVVNGTVGLLTQYAGSKLVGASSFPNASWAMAALELAAGALLPVVGDMNVHLLDMGFGDVRRRVECVGY